MADTVTDHDQQDAAAMNETHKEEITDNEDNDDDVYDTIPQSLVDLQNKNKNQQQQQDNDDGFTTSSLSTMGKLEVLTEFFRTDTLLEWLVPPKPSPRQVHLQSSNSNITSNTAPTNLSSPVSTSPSTKEPTEQQEVSDPTAATSNNQDPSKDTTTNNSHNAPAKGGGPLFRTKSILKPLFRTKSILKKWKRAMSPSKQPRHQDRKAPPLPRTRKAKGKIHRSRPDPVILTTAPSIHSVQSNAPVQDAHSVQGEP